MVPVTCPHCHTTLDLIGPRGWCPECERPVLLGRGEGPDLNVWCPHCERDHHHGRHDPTTGCHYDHMPPRRHPTSTSPTPTMSPSCTRGSWRCSSHGNAGRSTVGRVAATSTRIVPSAGSARAAMTRLALADIAGNLDAIKDTVAEVDAHHGCWRRLTGEVIAILSTALDAMYTTTPPTTGSSPHLISVVDVDRGVMWLQDELDRCSPRSNTHNTRLSRTHRVRPIAESGCSTTTGIRENIMSTTENFDLPPEVEAALAECERADRVRNQLAVGALLDSISGDRHASPNELLRIADVGKDLLYAALSHPDATPAVLEEAREHWGALVDAALEEMGLSTLGEPVGDLPPEMTPQVWAQLRPEARDALRKMPRSAEQ